MSIIRAIEQIKYAIILFLIPFSSCGQKDIYTSFAQEIKKSIEVEASRVDTVHYKDIVFFTPKFENDLVNKALKLDNNKTIRDNKYLGAKIRYDLKQLSSKFISLVKSVYIEDKGAPRGFYAWDECLNYYLYNDTMYVVSYLTKDNFRQQLRESVNRGELDGDCLKIDFKQTNNVSFYLSKGEMFLHNPFDSPFCDIDLMISFSLEDIEFGR